MKKFFAIVLAVAMVLSMSSAFAALGWNQSTSTATAKANVTISVKALEYSGTSQDYTQYGLSSGSVWKEITGRVVKDTLVKFPVVVNVPNASAAGLYNFDYVNGTITITLTNATIWKIVDANGYDYVSDNGSVPVLSNNNHVAKISVSPSATATNGTSYGISVLAIVDSSAAVDCTAKFTMGQTLSSTQGGTVYFGSYEATWKPGEFFRVTDSNGASVIFALDANNKFTSNISFDDPYVRSNYGFQGRGRGNSAVPVSYCLNGELAFDGYCACNRQDWPSDIVANAWYEQIKADFNKIMNAIGFSFSYGNFSTAYCTAAGILSLTNQVSVSSAVNLVASTDLAVAGTVAIPQTGAVSLLGYGLVTLAGAALAISKKRK